MLESKFQADLKKELKERFEGCIVIKNEAFQGAPDLLILYKNHWAALECKQSLKSKRQPNQEYYVNIMNNMSYANFICPENKEEILNEIQRSFEV